MASNPHPTQIKAYHIDDGETDMYTVDANSAVALHPDEWSRTPWTPADADAARQRRNARHQAAVADAKARGLPEPQPPIPGRPPLVLTPEEQAALDKFRADQAEAKKRLDVLAKEEAERAERAEQIAADKALLAASPPMPDPNAPRRMFGRTGEPTAREKAAMEKAAAEKAERDRAKAAADLPAANQFT